MPPHPWTHELRCTLRLAAPIVAVQLGQVGLGIVDVVMVGRWSDEALAGIALGNMYVWALLAFGYGVLTSLDPVVSQAVGAGRDADVRSGVQRGVALALLIGVPLTGLCLLAAPFYRLLDQPDAVVPLATAYVHWSMPGMLPFVLFVALRQSLQALSTVRPVLWTMLGANALNVLLNWMLVFGNVGMPALGLRGAAAASDICRIWLALGVLWAGWPVLRPRLRPFDPAAFRPRAWLPLLRLGLPIGGQFLLEMGAFSAAMLLIGQLGALQLAGHKVALTLASASFMVPVGISAAAAVRVGYAVGRADPDGVRRAATVALLLGSGVMAVFGALFLLMPETWAWLFTDSPAVVPLAAALVPLAGVFQVFDGVQVVCIGVLRGLAETRTALVVNVLGFWVIGLPLGWWLGLHEGLGARGLWWGLVAGLAAVACTLLARVVWRLRRAPTGSITPGGVPGGAAS